MAIKSQVIGLDRLKMRLDNLPHVMTEEMRVAIGKSAVEIQGQARRNIQRGSRSGRIYKVRKTGGRAKMHQASAPGEYPKTMFGILAGSIFARSLIGPNPAAEVGTAVRYGKFLEDKPANSGGRPWLKRSFNEVKPRIIVRLTKAVAASVRRSFR